MYLLRRYAYYKESENGSEIKVYLISFIVINYSYSLDEFDF
jgi:hypothetical protein